MVQKARGVLQENLIRVGSMDKPLLVINGPTIFNSPSPHHTLLLEKYFRLGSYDHGVNYPDGTTFVYSAKEKYNDIKHYNNGRNKFIVDSLWENFFDVNDEFDDNTMGIICNYHKNKKNIHKVPAWFWYEEHFSQSHQKPVSMPFEFDKTNSFLMQIGRTKSLRTDFFEDLSNEKLLDKAKYSYLGRGIGLEGSNKVNDVISPYVCHQRNYLPEWYNSTHFTVVVETHQDQGSVFLTEKTFKPIMYGHPFILYGQQRSLEMLKNLGFETYDTLFDESYDEIENIVERRQKIIAQIQSMPKGQCREVVSHNFDLFWNRKQVEQGMVNNVIKPILEFINKA